MELTDVFVNTDAGEESEAKKAFRQVLSVVIHEFLSENKEELLRRAKAEIDRVIAEPVKEKDSAE